MKQCLSISILFLCLVIAFAQLDDAMVSQQGSADAYDILDVKRPSRFLAKSKPLSRIKRFTWKLHGWLIPLLHGFSAPNEVCVNLRVLWNKALSAIDPSSPVYEHPHFFTFRLLPKYSRWIIRTLPRWMFPRWYHANIELRTAFLNRAIDKVLSDIHHHAKPNDTKIRLILLGGGYDTKAIHLLALQKVQQVWEFDLKEVVDFKRKLLSDRKLLVDSLSTALQLIPIDLNQPEDFRRVMLDMTTRNDDNSDPWYTIVVAEAIFLYLRPDIPERLLQVCSDIFGAENICLCFADRFIEIKSNTDKEVAKKWFSTIGWRLDDWLSKDGATRHMGIAYPKMPFR